MRQGAKILIAGGGLSVLALGLFTLSTRFALIPKPQRTVNITNTTDRAVNMFYIQSTQNTWHTPVSDSDQLTPGERTTYRYQQGDSISAGEIDPDDGSMSDQTRSINFIELGRESALRVVVDELSGELKIEPEPEEKP